MPIPTITYNTNNLYFIGDLHLDHTNIIKYCKRPFNSTNEMNNYIVDTWNNCIKESDTIIFLGDLAFGRESRTTDYWLSKLNGKIIFLKGNHDKSKTITIFDSLILNHKQYKFYITHNPVNVPSSWKNWVIHGHEHNHNLKDFPLINKEKKRINVSAELLNYKPLKIDVLIKLIKC